MTQRDIDTALDLVRETLPQLGIPKHLCTRKLSPAGAAVGELNGALLTGVFNSPSLGGPSAVGDWVTVAMVTPDAYSIASQVWIQAKAVMLTIVWSGVVSVVAFKIVDLTIGLRVTEEEEREGLDISSHGESAYHG